MRPVVFLRIASVLTLIHAALHTIGGVFGGVAAGAQQAAVTAMKTNEFLALGAMRSYWDFYRGMGLAVSIFLTAEGIVFWQLGSMLRSDGARLRPILMTFLAAYLAMAVNSYRYFFSGPVITEILIALCLGLAIAGTRQITTDEVDKRAFA